MDGHYGNAMTEIALALAMAFFSIMVLAMVSMGAGSQPADVAGKALPDSLKVLPSKPATGASSATGQPPVIVFYQGQYLDEELIPLDVDRLPAGEAVVLAIDPALPLSAAIQARTGLGRKNITVTTLDQRWMRALEETVK